MPSKQDLRVAIRALRTELESEYQMNQPAFTQRMLDLSRAIDDLIVGYYECGKSEAAAMEISEDGRHGHP